MNKHRVVTIIVVIIYLLYLIGVLWIWSNPEREWVLFIFNQVKLGLSLVYISSIVAISLFIILDFEKLKSKNTLRGSLIILLMLSMLTVIYLWRIAGYYFITGMDIYNYIGMSKDLIINGFIPQAHYPNFYPGHPILHASIAIVSSIPVIESFTYFTGLLYSLGVVFVLISLKRFFNRSLKTTKILNIFWTISLPNLFGMFIYPYNHTYAIIIFFILSYSMIRLFQREYLNWVIVQIVLISAITVAHPIVSVIMVMVLSCLAMAEHGASSNYLKNLALASIISVSAWYLIMTSNTWGWNIRIFVWHLFKQTTVSSAVQLTNKTIHVVSVSRYILFVIFTIFPALAYSILYLMSLRHVGNTPVLEEISSLGAPRVRRIVMTTTFVLVSYSVLGMISLIHTPLRLVLDNPLIILVVLIATVQLMVYYTEQDTRKQFISTIVISLIFIIVLSEPMTSSQIKVYPSQTKTWQEATMFSFFETTGILEYHQYRVGSFTHVDSWLSKDLGLMNVPTHDTYVPTKGLDNLPSHSYVFGLNKDILIYAHLYAGYKYPKAFFNFLEIKLNKIYSTTEGRIYEN